MKAKIGFLFMLLVLVLGGCASVEYQAVENHAVENHPVNPLIGQWDAAFVTLTLSLDTADRMELGIVSFDEKYLYLNGIPIWEYRFDGQYYYMKAKDMTEWDDKYGLVATETGYMLVSYGGTHGTMSLAKPTDHLVDPLIGKWSGAPNGKWDSAVPVDFEEGRYGESYFYVGSSNVRDAGTYSRTYKYTYDGQYYHMLDKEFALLPTKTGYALRLYGVLVWEFRKADK